MTEQSDRADAQRLLPRCETCLFWHALNPDGEGVEADGNYDVREDGVGRCRRYPPRGKRADAPTGSNAFDVALWAEWPLTIDEDWCGEHRAIMTEQQEIRRNTIRRYREMDAPNPQPGNGGQGL